MSRNDNSHSNQGADTMRTILQPFFNILIFVILVSLIGSAAVAVWTLITHLLAQ